jgi:GNAT superfamily N-acetyltransferase
VHARQLVDRRSADSNHACRVPGVVLRRSGTVYPLAEREREREAGMPRRPGGAVRRRSRTCQSRGTTVDGVSPLDGYDFERLALVDASVVSDLNLLIPQLKPSWDPLTEPALAALVASESLVYVARHGDRVVGLTVMVPHRHLPGLRYHVEDVVIAQEHRGLGVGRQLLEFAMRDVPGPVMSFDVRSHASRTRAHQLYSSLGFQASDTTVFRLDVGASDMPGHS